MPQRVHDRVKETTTSTGIGNITLLGAVTQFQPFYNHLSIGEPFYYAIVGQTGTEWEVGRGIMLSATSFARVACFESSNTSGLQPNIVYSPVNFSAGTKDVFVTIPAERIEESYTKGQANALFTGLARC